MPEFDTVIDLDDIADFNGYKFLGASENDNFGRPATVVGDINGDGIDDFLFGAGNADYNNRGRAYVVFGGDANLAALDAASGAVDRIIDINDLDGTNGFAFVGNVVNAEVGLSAAGAGDVNGDGIDDLIIGGRTKGGVNDSGRAFLVFGATSFNATVQATLDGSDGYVINGVGTNASEQFGYAVSSAGDFNGDGFDDILVTARNGDPISGVANVNEGATYLILGGDANLMDLDDDDGILDGSILIANLQNDEGAVFAGDPTNFNAGLGRGVSAAGDINGDGFDDFIVGSPFADPSSGFGDENEGASYIVFGRADMSTLGSPERLEFSSGLNSVELRGVDAGDLSGFAVGGGGDVNGDGFDDIVIGAFRADGPGAYSSGSAYVVFGKSAWGGAFELSSLNGDNGFRVDGLRERDYTGIAVSMAGDINGDGFDDVAIAANTFDKIGFFNVGAVYIVFGKAKGFDAVIDLGTLDGDNGFRVVGPDDSDADLGRGMTGPSGDINGDGFDDLVLGTYLADTVNGTYSGAGYILFGHKAQGSVTRIGTHLGQTQNGGTGDDLIRGKDGDDTLIGHEGDDQLYGGAGNDILNGGADNANGGDDILRGKSGQDIIIAGGGNDEIYGGSGKDTLDLRQLDTSLGGAVLDLATGTLTTGNGDLQSVKSIERVFGTKAADTISGNYKGNTLNGGSGDDTIDGKDGGDTLNGQNGNDTIDGGLGEDTIFGGTGKDDIKGGADKDSIFGEDGDDKISGGGADDVLRGQNGNDDLSGKSGNDTLRGGGDKDTLNGGTGDDVLNGGGGNDTFIFADGDGDDIVEDFNATSNAEKLDLSAVTAISNIGQFNSAASQVGADVMIDTGSGNSILLMGVDLGDLGNGDFIF